MKKTIHRVSDRKGAKYYTPISNSILQSKDLTFDQVGLLTYLLSLPVQFTIVQKNVLRKCAGRISNGGLRTAWKALVEKGYIVKVITYKNNLRREGWKVYEDPSDRESQNQDSRKQSLLESNQEEI